MRAFLLLIVFLFAQTPSTKVSAQEIAEQVWFHESSAEAGRMQHDQIRLITPHLDATAFPTEKLIAMQHSLNAVSSTASRKWQVPGNEILFTVNINTTQAGGADGSEADFLQAILDAAATWNRVPEADFTLHYAGRTQATQTSYNQVNEIVFMHKGPAERAGLAQIWYNRNATIVEADIWINEDYDWNAAGKLEAHELDLQSVLVHEFGHWLVLGHFATTDAIMYPSLAPGTVKRSLHPYDISGIAAIYPCAETACVPQ